MAMDKLLNVADKAYKIFIFNPETVRGAKEFVAGHFEWSWIILMLAAVLLWNIKLWNYFRDERNKMPPTVLRAVAEGIVHWCLSNAVLFVAMEMNRIVYDAFTDYVPEKCCPSGAQGPDGIRGAMMGALTKMRLVNGRTAMVPHVRNPSIPFALMLTTSLIAVLVAFFVRNDQPIEVVVGA